ncbi:MAG: hypothetical protein IPM92_04070 [Saprospiraceae bacterium]|nr:hypothetical protein [Saprospiraceae bacterium]
MEATIYKCFIGSPGDTIDERIACKEIIRHINKTIGEKFNFRVETLMWEDDSRPSFADDGQAVINRQLLLKEYHVFIGIMWSRFGSPTDRAESGTVEEFEDAYSKYESRKDIEICMYFNKKIYHRVIWILNISPRYSNLKKRVASLGGFYNEYIGTEQFKDNLRLPLTKSFLEELDLSKNERIIEIQTEEKNDVITKLLNENLSNTLSVFDGYNPCWIEPILCKTDQISSNYVDNFNARIDLNEIIDTPKSIIIKSPPQFGLTSLARYFILKAWLNNDIWLYIDAKDINRNSIEKGIVNELRRNFQTDNITLIKCIVLDSWKVSLHGGMRLLRNITNTFKNTPIIVMQTIESAEFLNDSQSEKIEREFEIMHLLALPKTEIRKMVSSYNEIKYIQDEDKLLNKIVLDLDTLNIHRTPLNCLTLLKVSEKYFDERTVNRSDMLNKVLFILFDLNADIGYSSIPDLKDCEFVIGALCEDLIRRDKYHFTKDEFLLFSKKTCAESYITLNTKTLFEILNSNGIIEEKSNVFTFRARYWLFYFAANRMHANPDFCKFIFESGKYVNYPEIIEFYTGIDRRRTDAISILNNDLKLTCNDVLNKLGIPQHVDPYLKVEWNPSNESIEKARDEINKNVQASKLPPQIKDQHADSRQNQLRPYDQGIYTILNEYSLAVLMRKIVASSRALRNSDYANSNVKKAMIDSIITSYEQVAKALMILTPELAIKGRAAYEGQSFNLEGDFGDSVDERINMILQHIPGNIIKFFKDDINSEKMGPLLLDKFEQEKIPLNKHILALLIISMRFHGWRKSIENYIGKLKNNSFYLFDLMGHLRHLYFYDYSNDTELATMKHLLLLGYSRHEFGNSNPPKATMIKLAQQLFKRPDDKESQD